MTKDQAIKTAAKWWADKLKQRSPHSNGDNSPSSVLACILADMNAGAFADEQLEVFTQELEVQIRDFMNQYPKWMAGLHCDYGPCAELTAAAEKAGIDLLCFPYKTHMHIIKNDDDEFVVKVSDGYAQPWEEIEPIE